MFRRNVQCVFMVLPALMAMADSVLMADTYVFSSGAGGNWSDTTRWSGGLVGDGANNTAQFVTALTSIDRTVSLDSSRTIGNLYFRNASNNTIKWILSPSSSSNVLTLARDSGTPTITVMYYGSLATQVGTTTVSTVFGGTSGFSKEGIGTLNWLTDQSNKSTLTGDIHVSAGKLVLNKVSGGGNFNPLFGIFYDYGQTVVPTRTWYVASGGTLDAAIANSLNTSYVVGQGAKMVLQGGVLTCSTAGQYSFLNNVTMNTAASSITGQWYVGYYTDAKVTVEASASGSIIAGNLLGIYKAGESNLDSKAEKITFDVARGASAVDLTINAGKLFKYWGANNELAVVKDGDGIVLLAGDNTYAGKTVINAGTLQIGGEGCLGGAPVASFSADHLTLNGGSLKTTASFAIDDSWRGVTLGSSGGTFTPNSATNLTVANAITGSGGLNMNGAGTLTLSGANTYAGNTTISSGAFKLESSGQILLDINSGTTSSSQITAGGGSLLLDGLLGFDLTGIGPTGGTWTAIAATSLGNIYGDNFHVAFTYGTTTQTLTDRPADGVWSYTDTTLQATATFTESTGLLEVTIVPEPAGIVLLSTAIVGLIAYAWRRRR